MSDDIDSDAQSAPRDTEVDSRTSGERRRPTFQTFVRSSTTPRRRGGRREEERDGVVDWHEPQLLFLALMIVVLSVSDAFFTLTLLTNGAVEVNPVLAYLLQNHPAYFAILKMTLTGVGVTVLVAMARKRVFKVVRVKTVLQWFLAGYVVLIAYEVWLMRAIL